MAEGGNFWRLDDLRVRHTNCIKILSVEFVYNYKDCIRIYINIYLYLGVTLRILGVEFEICEFGQLRNHK